MATDEVLIALTVGVELIGPGKVSGFRNDGLGSLSQRAGSGGMANENQGGGCGVWIAIIIVLAVIGSFMGDDDSSSSGGGGGGSSSSSDDRYVIEETAKDVCADAVRAQLKSPGTADFGGEIVSVIGDDISIVGHVDSENGFGALLRATWTCEARVDGDYVRLVGSPLVIEGG
jgi:hypothetical protein